ncbi:MAG TPA: hypothetical protein VF145_11940 [Chitinophagaceae bacterium]
MTRHPYYQLRPALFIPVLFFWSLNVFSQAAYSGFIGEQPVEMVMDLHFDGYARAIYAYNKYNEPIAIVGRYAHDTLTFAEKNTNGTERATLQFEHFDPSAEKLNGYWQATGTSNRIPVRLSKSFELEPGDSIEWNDREIIQPVSLPGQYFRLVVSKTKGVFYPYVTGVKVLEKKTGRLIQQFDLECQLRGLENLETGDYNFDGIREFSVFESSYAGPNTSRIYFLYDTASKQYFNSGFEGTSLEFDAGRKRIYEHNQCCGGRSHMNAEYKLVNNKMVLVKRSCLEYDEKTEDFREVTCD